MENVITTEKLDTTYKKYLKDLISENIENVLFVKYTQETKAEQFIADTTQSENISQVTENFPTERDLKAMWNVANEIRKTLLGSKWKFEGDMNNYETSDLLQTFLKWVLLRPYDRLDTNKEKRCQK